MEKAEPETQFHIESAATSTEEIGSPAYLSAGRKLAEHGINCTGKTERQLINSDCNIFDLLTRMDRANLRNMHCICGGAHEGKTHLLTDYTGHPGYVADPWYTDNFETKSQDVLMGCCGLLDMRRKQDCWKSCIPDVCRYGNETLIPMATIPDLTWADAILNLSAGLSLSY